MKLVEKKQNVKKKEGMREFLAEMEQNVVFIYLFCMLGIFPLWYKQAYSKIGSVKFEFFWNVSLVFIGVSILFLLSSSRMTSSGPSKSLSWNVNAIAEAPLACLSGQHEMVTDFSGFRNFFTLNFIKNLFQANMMASKEVVVEKEELLEIKEILYSLYVLSISSI